MFKRSLFTVMTLALAACGEEDPVGAGSSPDYDASTSAPDASTPSPDAGAPTSDAGTPSVAAKFFLPTNEPTNTAAPSIELDAQGNAHMVYPKFVRGDAFYAFCAKGKCQTENDMQVVELETDGTVSNAMIALTADGKPRILLNSFAYLYYGECDSDCGVRSNWQYQMILKHDNDKEVTGEAFTLDQNGHPRFLIATYRALFGIGQKPAKTELAQCDVNCTSPDAWSYSTIAEPEIWYGSTLRYDATGRMHVATNLFDYKTENPSPDVAAYLTCASNCSSVESWLNSGVGFFAPYESSSEAISMKPAVTLALTAQGKPRFAQIHKNQDGVKTVSYFSCDKADCSKPDSFIYAWSYSGTNVHGGVDLALDAQDHPRLVHTADYNIAISYCDDADCATATSKWSSKLIEQGGEIPADDIFLEWNCTIGAWFLHNPSIAIGKDGKPVVGYQARDVSGGFSKPDPSKPGCVAGTDMTWSRLAVSDSAY
ncbi:MAG TPA: hypothetical protein VFX59_13410 [Polyangiales bacterium]|nr:hypothetical protein [Polyangiales bacterium]